MEQEKNTSIEYEFEAELDTIKSSMGELEKMRKEYYENMKSAPDEYINRELEVLDNEIAGLEIEKSEIGLEIMELRNFKFMLIDVLRKRKGE